MGDLVDSWYWNQILPYIKLKRFHVLSSRNPSLQTKILLNNCSKFLENVIASVEKKKKQSSLFSFPIKGKSCTSTRNDLSILFTSFNTISLGHTARSLPNISPTILVCIVLITLLTKCDVFPSLEFLERMIFFIDDSNNHINVYAYFWQDKTCK